MRREPHPYLRGELVVVIDCSDLEAGWQWHILADPDGNEFCVLQPPASHWPARGGW
jgi:hypothetical protein